MFKHGVLVPILFLLSTIVFGFYNHEALSKEYGIKTNIFHDVIGGKILSDNEIEFEKIVVTRGKDVLFCDSKQTLFAFVSKKNKVFLQKRNSSKCGKVLTQNGVKKDNGTGKLFGSIFKALKKDKKSDSENSKKESKKIEKETK